MEREEGMVFHPPKLYTRPRSSLLKSIKAALYDGTSRLAQFVVLHYIDIPRIVSKYLGIEF